jgi:hypothetical protein
VGLGGSAGYASDRGARVRAKAVSGARVRAAKRPESVADQGLAASVVVDQVDEVLSDPIGVDKIGTRFGAVLDLVDAYPQQFHAEQPRMLEVLFAGAAGFRASFRLVPCNATRPVATAYGPFP